MAHGPFAELALLRAVKQSGVTGDITGVVGDETHAQALRAAGATRVINPFYDAADHAAQMITDALNPSENDR